MTVERLKRINDLQARIRARWQKAIDVGDFCVARVMVKRLQRLTFSVWIEKAAS